MRAKEWKRAVMLSAIAGAILLLTGCADTTVIGSDAGCRSYAEARLAMPRDVDLPPGAWGSWVADLDARMTGTCT